MNAFRNNVQAAIPALRRYARALTRDAEIANNLVQDTLVRAFRSEHLFHEGDVRSWLYTILHNRFLSEQHRAKRRGLHDSLNDQMDVPGIDGGQDSALEHRDLIRGFSLLPEEQRSVLLLIAVEDLSYEESARVLGVPIGTVMSRLSRGRERLRQLMYGDINEEDSHRQNGVLRRVK